MNQPLGLLCVHAHPDDEAISTGGVLARHAAEGLRTAVVTCTGGERGEIWNMDVESIRPRLAEVRRAELEASLRLLGAGPPRLLGYVDSGMMGTEGNTDPASFWRADLDEAVRRLVALLREFRPDVVVLYDPFGSYGHPDHIQAHRVGLLAAEASDVAALYPDAGQPWRVRKLYYSTIPKSAIVRLGEQMAEMGLPSPFGEWERPEDVPMGAADDQVTTMVDVRGQLPTKMAALRAHDSQLDRSSFFLNLPSELEVEAFGRESFVRLRSDVHTTDPEDDLFAGLR